MRAVCDYLALRKHLFWRQNTAPAVQKSEDGWKFRSMPKHSLRGVPDIIVIDKTGHFVGLEVKRAKGKLSPDQLEFQRRCKENAAEYHVVRSIDDVKEIGL